jgi:hypothetical protein
MPGEDGFFDENFILILFRFHRCFNKKMERSAKRNRLMLLAKRENKRQEFAECQKFNRTKKS